MTPSLRESFEAWYGTVAHYPDFKGYEANGKWHYLNPMIDSAWHGWQASAASMAEQAAKVVDEETKRSELRMYYATIAHKIRSLKP